MAVYSLQKYLLVAKIFNNVKTKEEWKETKERQDWKLFIALSDKNSPWKNAHTDKNPNYWSENAIQQTTESSWVGLKDENGLTLKPTG